MTGLGLGATGGPACRFLCVAVADRRALGLSGVDSIGTGVVLDSAGALNGSRFGGKGVAVDAEGASGITSVLNRRGCLAGNSTGGIGVSTTGLGASVVLAVVAVVLAPAAATVVLAVAALVALALTGVTLTGVALTSVALAGVALTGIALAGVTLALTGVAVAAGVVVTTGVVVATGVVVTAIVVAAGVGTVPAGTANAKVAAVLLRATLGNRHQNRLVVGGTAHGADTVATGGETASHRGGKPALAVSGIIDALEEGELGGIKWLGRVQRITGVLDRDVGVTDDLARPIEVLWRRIVGAGGIGERTELHVGNIDLDVEGLERREVVTVLGVENDSRDHPVDCGNLAHCCAGVSKELADVFREWMDIRIPLQEPSRFCRPLVTVWPEQKLMKLALSLWSVSIDKPIHHGRGRCKRTWPS